MDIPQNLNEGRLSHLRTIHFTDLLARGIDIQWGHNLHQEGINITGGAITQKYSHEKVIKTVKGSMLVGADGQFSTGDCNSTPCEKYVIDC